MMHDAGCPTDGPTDVRTYWVSGDMTVEIKCSLVRPFVVGFVQKAQIVGVGSKRTRQ